MNEEFDDRMGQGLPPGEPDPDALAAVEKFNNPDAVPEGAELQPDEGGVVEPTGMVADEQAQAVIDLIARNPAIAAKLVEVASTTDTGRKILNIPAGRGAPSGQYKRNYDNEPALRVHGGVEVRHHDGFCPLPPSFIKMYIRADGGRTDNPREAALDNGTPMKTPEYKTWIDHKAEGRRMDSQVATDMGQLQIKPDGSPAVQQDVDGAPMTTADASIAQIG